MGRTISADFEKLARKLGANRADVRVFKREIRKAIYTTNAIESLNMSMRKTIKTRGSFPSEQACLKLMYLGLKNVAKKWTMPIPNWGLAINQFAIMFEDRLPLEELNSVTQNF